jgi:LysR family transcriptional activator of mexEF-oprN operon
MDITQIDIYALECLQLVVNERSVTKAGDKLGISQPSMSNVIARLRRVTGDPLIVRRADGMVPTPFAEALVMTSAAFLDRLRELAIRHETFDPASSTRTFVLLAVDYITATVASRLMQRIRDEAPGVSLIVGPLDIRNIKETLEKGEADFAITPSHAVPETLYGTVLAPHEMVCIAKSNHPILNGTLTLEQFVAVPHAALSFGDAHSPYVTEQLTDEILASQGLSRFKAIQVASVLALPAIVAETDLIAVVPLDLAERASRTWAIDVYPLPIARPPPQHMVVWHARSIGDPGSQWLRSLLRKL